MSMIGICLDHIDSLLSYVILQWGSISLLVAALVSNIVYGVSNVKKKV